MENIKIGIDLGGSHIAIGVVNNLNQIIEKYEKDFTEEEKKDLLNIVIKYIIEITQLLKQKYEFSKVGIGMAGTISNGVVLKSVNLGIKNFDLKKELELKTGLKFTIRNDAKCVAIAEYTTEDLKPYKNVLFLTLGTGIGGSYIYEANLMKGTIFEGFEFGHIIIKENGLQCNCGKKGCFEKYASILVFKKRVIERLHLQKNISGPELRDNINKSIDKIQDIIEEYVYNLAIGLSNLINIFEPDCIVIGGGFAKYDYLFLNKLEDKILNSNLLFNSRDKIVIKTAKMGNDAGIIGASF